MPAFHKRLNSLGRNGFYWVLDYLYVARVLLLSPFRRTPPEHYLHDSGDKPAIILIPGIYESWYFMKSIADALAIAGYAVHVVDGLGYNRGTVEDMAVVISEYIHRHGLADCIIVAHSKGGLIGKQVLMHHNEHGPIKGLVALNTPFSGSPYARLVPLNSVRVFVPGSDTLARLGQDQAANQKITSIYGRFDPHIPGGSFLEGARNVQLSTYGHFRILNDRRIQKAVVEAVRHYSA